MAYTLPRAEACTQHFSLILHGKQTRAHREHRRTTNLHRIMQNLIEQIKKRAHDHPKKCLSKNFPVVPDHFSFYLCCEQNVPRTSQGHPSTACDFGVFFHTDLYLHLTRFALLLLSLCVQSAFTDILSHHTVEKLQQSPRKTPVSGGEKILSYISIRRSHRLQGKSLIDYVCLDKI